MGTRSHLSCPRRTVRDSGSPLPLLVALWALLVFIWTNPPQLDTHIVRFFVTAQDSLGGAWTFDVPVSFDPDSAQAGPGQLATQRITLPCSSRPRPYAASCIALDDSGHASSTSNVINFTAP